MVPIYESPYQLRHLVVPATQDQNVIIIIMTSYEWLVYYVDPTPQVCLQNKWNTNLAEQALNFATFSSTPDVTVIWSNRIRQWHFLHKHMIIPP
jgi:hypothetical protein